MKTFFRWIFLTKHEYWKGRSDGWYACEGMVLRRAMESGKFASEKEAWEALLQ